MSNIQMNKKVPLSQRTPKKVCKMIAQQGMAKQGEVTLFFGRVWGRTKGGFLHEMSFLMALEERGMFVHRENTVQDMIAERTLRCPDGKSVLHGQSNGEKNM